ncbi:hypothetical protein Dimus_020731 [Dionaea muscipula]
MGWYIVLKTKPQELYEIPAEEEGEDDCNPIEKDAEELPYIESGFNPQPNASISLQGDDDICFSRKDGEVHEVDIPSSSRMRKRRKGIRRN